MIILCIPILALLIAPVISFNNKTTCLTTTYFNTANQDCQSCYSNQSPSGPDAVSCQCANGFFGNDSTLVGWNTVCTECPAGQGIRSDGFGCIPCPGGVSVNPVTKDCDCGDGRAVNDIGTDGNFLATKQCLNCTNETFPGPYAGRSIRQCKACPAGKTYKKTTTPWSCECNQAAGFTTAGDKCVVTADIEKYLSAYPLTSAYVYKYYEVDTGSGGPLISFSNPKSDAINYLYYKSAIGCLKEKDPQSCQALANLCVLTLYNLASTICRLYKTLEAKTTETVASTLGWYKDYPFLFYGGDPVNILNNPRLKLEVSFDPSSTRQFYRLKFYLKKYDLEGAYLGLEKLEGQFMWCPYSITDVETFQNFGTGFGNECQMDISNYIKRTNKMYFYELFIQDSDGTLVPIPILNDNLRDQRETAINHKGSMNDFILTTRFFNFDNLSGVQTEGGYVSGATSTILTFPKFISLKYKLRNDVNEKIYVPYLFIHYESKRDIDLVNVPNTKVSFFTHYIIDTKNFWNTCQALFITTNIIIGIVWLLRLFIWGKYNQSKFYGGNYGFNGLFWMVILLLDTWAIIIFFFLFFILGYWFVFYKFQDKVYLIVPYYDDWDYNYRPFTIVFSMMVTFKLLTTLILIWKQSRINIFFIDWEKPKGALLAKDAEAGNTVSVWRTLFIANELNELQYYRIISTEWTLFFLGFFLTGLSWERASQMTPFISTTLDDKVLWNYLLKYFLATFVYLIIGLAQLITRKILTIWIPTKVQEFVDLCTVSNISIFILDEAVHGYYIHGQSPNGISEGTAEDLQRALDQESKGNSRSRGLLPDDPTYLQTFEIFIPWEMRIEYNGKYNYHLENEVSRSNQILKSANAGGMINIPKSLPKTFDFKAIEEKKKNLSRILKIYIESVVKQKEKQILHKTFWQRILTLPPTDLASLRELPIFYRDIDNSFKSIFFCGNEFAILITDICIYNMWDVILGNTLKALIITYVFIKFYEMIKIWTGKRNMAKKTLIDEKFLI